MINSFSRSRNRALAALAMLAFMLPACQKKRSPEFIQGDGEYIYKISDFDNSTYNLKTFETVAPAIASDADEIVLPEGNSVIRSFTAVGFEGDIELAKISNKVLNDFSFFGREASPNAYKLQLGFTENHLVVYKVANKNDIPSDEMTYAIPTGAADTYKVPMLGYPLKKYVLEYVKDSRGKETKQKRSIPKDFLAESTHFSIDASSPEYFQSELKTNLLPSSFFDEKSEWYYEVTQVDGPLNTQLGTQLSSGKARFARTSNSLMAVDVNIPEEAESLSGEKLEKIIQLPVRWVDFKLVQSGSKAYMEEKLLDGKDAGAVDWKERKFGLFDFRRINNLDSANANSIRVNRLEVDDNYFSVIISSSQTGDAVHFSFARANDKIGGRTYPLLDRRKFGFFSSVKQSYPGQLTVTEKNVEQNTFLNRMYVGDDNVIDVYLTDNTPDIPIFIDSIDKAMMAWDQAFVEAARGTKYESNPIRVKLHRDKKVKNGDVRYNKVSFYDFNIDVGNLLGYGPSVTDSRNGEIHSSTNHIYLRTYRESIYADLKSYIRYRLGLYDDKAVRGVDYPNQVLRNVANLDVSFDSVSSSPRGLFARELGYVGSEASTEAKSSKVSQYLPKSFADSAQEAWSVVESKGANQVLTADQKRYLAEEFSRRAAPGAANKKNHQDCGFRAGVFNTFHEIEKFCGNLKFGDYVNQLAAENRSEAWLEQLNFDSEIFNECAFALLAPTLQYTLVHEFGHNLGLTHNFMGSADGENFRRDANRVPLARTTSVMDYPDRDEGGAFEPGTYDVAAIRYGYYDAVELKEKDSSGKPVIVSIASENPKDTRPIEQRVPSPDKLKNFLYCWDRDIFTAEVPLEDVRCRRHDRGSNPVEMVYALIDRFNSYSTMNMHRFESSRLPDIRGAINNSIILPLRSIYTQYRYMLHLKTKSIGLNDPYFFKNEASYNSFIEKYVGKAKIEDLPKDPAQLEAYVSSLSEIEQYKLASDVIFRFLKQVSFVEDRYCTFWKDEEFVTAIPFTRVRSMAFNRSKLDNKPETIRSCVEAPKFISEYANLTVKEYGNTFSEIPYSADEAQWEVKAPVSAGIGLIRDDAFRALTSRLVRLSPTLNVPPLLVAAVGGFQPSFMDDPNFRKDLLTELERRLVNGVDVTKFGAKVRPGNEANSFISQFSEEKDLLAAMYPNILASVYAPGENAANRLKALRPDVYNRADFERVFPDTKKIAFVASADGSYFVSEDPESSIYRLISRFKEVSSLIGDSTRYDALSREKDQAIKAALRIQSAFFVEWDKQPTIDLNLLNLIATEEAIVALQKKYVPQVEGAPAPAEPLDAVLVSDLVAKASVHIDLAVQLGLVPDADFIRSIAFEISGAQVVQKDVIETLLSVVKPTESAYINLAYGLVAETLKYRATAQAAVAAGTPAPAPLALEDIAAKKYEELLNSLLKKKLEDEVFSQRGAQESILRSIILR